MSVRLVEGDIFKSNADALVNPVNCRGVMGKGLAKEFKKRFPETFPVYREACRSGKLVPGTLQFVRLTVKPDLFGWNKPVIIHFPTKDHWKDPSRLEWIEKGLAFLKEHYREWNLTSVALPQLGTGLGGLKWEEVKPLIDKYLSSEPLLVEVYANALGEAGENAARPSRQRVRKKLPNLASVRRKAIPRRRSTV